MTWISYNSEISAFTLREQNLIIVIYSLKKHYYHDFFLERESTVGIKETSESKTWYKKEPFKPPYLTRLTKSAHVWTSMSTPICSAFAWFPAFTPTSSPILCRAVDILASISREAITLALAFAFLCVVPPILPTIIDDAVVLVHRTYFAIFSANSAHVWTFISIPARSAFARFVVSRPTIKLILCRAVDLLAAISREAITLAFACAIHWVVLSTLATIIVIDPSHGTLAKLLLTSGTTAGSASWTWFPNFVDSLRGSKGVV